MLIKRSVLILFFISAGMVLARAEGPAQVEDAALVDKNWHSDASIVGAKDHDDKSILTDDDIVYLNAGTEDGLTPGTRCGIYKEGDAVKDPATGKVMGYDLKRLGTLQIMDGAAEHHASGLIIGSQDAIEIGDLVKKE